MSKSNPFRRALCALLFVCLSVPTFAQNQTPDLIGSWHGTLEDGSDRPRIVLTLTRAADGQYNAILDMVDGGATIPADKAALRGDKLRIDVTRFKGFYEGTVNKDASEITGSWMEGGTTPQPLSFKRGAADAAQKADSGQKKDEAKAAAPPQKPLTIPIDVMVPWAPTAAQADGKNVLVYELHITNFSGQPVTLTHIEALGESGAELARLGPNELITSVLSLGNRQAAGMDKLNIGPGQQTLVYMWVALDQAAKLPSALEHRISVKVGAYPDELSVKCARVAIGHDVPAISPPLRGDNWLAGNGPSNTSGHRRTAIPIDGRARIAQRFAIDWVQLNPDGKTYTGDAKDNKNYRAYGSEALAVADGTVVATKDGVPQNIPGENSRAVPITLETVGGNHIILDIGHGRYAFFAHLQPGSLKVKVGDHVKRGEVLGLVGNSGNSTEPHLHFHIGDGNSPLGSEGIPYVFQSFDAKAKAGSPLVKHRMEIPTEDEIVTFAEPSK
jgi:murein DD-endopeptidase MepM/ murein hydrolase activator NlpD